MAGNMGGGAGGFGAQTGAGGAAQFGGAAGGPLGKMRQKDNERGTPMYFLSVFPRLFSLAFVLHT